MDKTMYIFKSEALKNDVIDITEIIQWEQLLKEYRQSVNYLKFTKNEKQINFKKIQEQIELLLQQK